MTVPSSAVYYGEVSRAIASADGVSAVDDEGRARPLPMPSLDVARLTLLHEHSRHMSAREWAAAVAAAAALLYGAWRWLQARGCCAGSSKDTLRLPAKPGHGGGAKRGGRRGTSAVDAPDATALLRGGAGGRDDDDEDSDDGRDDAVEAAARAGLDAQRMARRGYAPDRAAPVHWPPPPNQAAAVHWPPPPVPMHPNPYAGQQQAVPMLPPPPPTAAAALGAQSATPAQDLLLQMLSSANASAHVDALLGPPLREGEMAPAGVGAWAAPGKSGDDVIRL